MTRDIVVIGGTKRPGTPSVFSCPDCGGVLSEIQDENLLRFRCRVGHALTAQTLLSAQSDNVETAMWSALRALEEKVELFRRLMQHSRERNYASATAAFEQQARQLQEQADIIRRLLTNENKESSGTES